MARTDSEWDDRQRQDEYIWDVLTSDVTHRAVALEQLRKFLGLTDDEMRRRIVAVRRAHTGW